MLVDGFSSAALKEQRSSIHEIAPGKVVKPSKQLNSKINIKRNPEIVSHTQTVEETLKG